MRATRRRNTELSTYRQRNGVLVHANMDGGRGAAPDPDADGGAKVAEDPYKRAFDLAAAGAALLLLAPFLLLVALAIRIETGGPVLFRQERTGYRGQVFTIFKFRTMRVTETGHEARQATRNDTRVTHVGTALRKLSLDELPQLLNILRGDMSLIGPRPHATGHDAEFARFIPRYMDRFRAKPGLTGLAQVAGHRGEIYSAKCIADRVAADCEYIDRWSFWLDMRILLRTVPLLFGDPKAY